MTREEAIEHLKNMKMPHDKFYEETNEINKALIDKGNEALEIAIETLEKEIGCKYCQYDNVDGKFDSLCMNCYSHDMWVRKENKE